MEFNIYDWIGEKQNDEKKIINTNTPPQLFFIREEIGNDIYICDEYSGENHIRNHVKIKLEKDVYEKKEIKATYKIREYYPDTARFVDNPRVFNSIAEIEEAITNNEIKTPLYSIWKISIFCDSDCRALGIDPAAPWPPKAA